MTWRPSPGQVVLLEPDDGGPPITGVVLAAGSEGAVRIDVTAGDRPTAPTGSVRASVFAADALYRLTGWTTAVARGVVELVVEQVERVQRRLVPRTRIALPITLSAFDDGPVGFGSVTGQTVDLSPGGCRVTTTEAFPPGAEATIVVRLPDGPPVVTAAHILQQHQRDDGHHEYRLVFTGLAEGDAARLAALAEPKP